MKISQLFESDDISDYEKRFPGVKLFHGSSSSKEGFYSFRYREAPTDTFKGFHNTVNELCEKKFGIPLRSLLFVSQSGYVASGYGDNIFKVIPEDGFRLFYSKKYTDMTTNMRVARDGMERKLKNIFYEKEVHLEPEEITRFYNVIGEFIPNSEDYDLDNLGDKVISLYKTFLPDDNIDIVKKDVYGLFEKLSKDAVEYVSTLKEAKSLNDLKGINEEAELMLYTPNGFIFIDH